MKMFHVKKMVVMSLVNLRMITTAGETTTAQTLNIRNGQVCGSVQFAPEELSAPQ